MHVIDQMGRLVVLPNSPQRIVSLVPSQTELLFDLGLGDRVVGITKFCIHPVEWFKTKTRVGGTKDVKLDIIRQLQPDLIIGNKEENKQEDIEQLMQHYPVWMSDIKTLEDAIQMIASVGQITNTENRAGEIIAEIKLGFEKLIPIVGNPTVLYLIWKPYMAAGVDTFINEMLTCMGFKNVLNAPPILRQAQYDGRDVTLSVAEASRYPEITNQQITQLQPDYILLSSEPFPFKEKHIAELQVLSPKSNILLVDGEMFSWYGSRLKYAPAYFKQLITDR